MEFQFIDVQIAEIQLQSFVDCCEVTETNLNKTIPVKSKQKPSQKLSFASSFVDFGILPLGVNISKEICIKNLTNDKIDWKVIEMKLNIDIPPYKNIILDKNDNISQTKGTLHYKLQLAEISYKITTKVPVFLKFYNLIQ